MNAAVSAVVPEILRLAESTGEQVKVLIDEARATSATRWSQWKQSERRMPLDAALRLAVFCDRAHPGFGVDMARALVAPLRLGVHRRRALMIRDTLPAIRDRVLAALGRTAATGGESVGQLRDQLEAWEELCREAEAGRERCFQLYREAEEATGQVRLGLVGGSR